jgi:hypothetical protein
VTEVPHIITPGGPIGRPGAMQGKPLRGRTATARDYTTRLPNWDVTRLASLSDGGRFRSTKWCDSVAINNKTKTNNKLICSALMGCSDARRVTSQSSSRHVKPPTRASSSHCHPNSPQPRITATNSPPTNSSPPHTSPPRICVSCNFTAH